MTDDALVFERPLDLPRMRRARHARLVDAMRAQQVDVLVLLGQTNVGYATGARRRAADQSRALHDRAVAVVTAAAVASRLEAFGAMETTARQVAISNTRGVRRHARTSIARLTAVVRGADGAGYADRCAAAVDDVDPHVLAAEVVDTASRNQRATVLGVCGLSNLGENQSKVSSSDHSRCCFSLRGKMPA